MEREFDRLFAKYHDAFNRAISMRDNDEDLFRDLEAARSEYLAPAIECAETINDCEMIKANLIVDNTTQRNNSLIENLIRKAKEIWRKNEIDFLCFLASLGKK